MPQLGGKSFVDRSTGDTPILQRSDTGSVNWESDWVQVPALDSGSNYSTLPITHNLGTETPIVQVYVKHLTTGKIQNIGQQLDEETGAITDTGASYQPTDANSGIIRFYENVFGEHPTQTGEIGFLVVANSSEYRVKVVATAGAGAGGADSTRYTVNEYPASTRAGGLTSDDASSNSWGSAWAGLKLVDFKDGLGDARAIVSRYTGYGTNGPVLSKGFEDLVSYVRINNVDWVVAGSYWIRPDVNLGGAEIDDRASLHWHNKVLSLWVNFNSLGVTSRGAYALVDVL